MDKIAPYAFRLKKKDREGRKTFFSKTENKREERRRFSVR